MIRRISNLDGSKYRAILGEIPRLLNVVYDDRINDVYWVDINDSALVNCYPDGTILIKELDREVTISCIEYSNFEMW